MSNYLAVATVTFVLQQQLQAAATAAVSGATVATGRPDSPQNGAPGPRVNLYLYQAAPNAALRNTDIPTRRADGTLVQRPQAALDLYYLISFYGNEAQLEPQRLMGNAVSALHANPLLTRESIRSAIASALQSDPDHFLGASDLAEQVECVKLSPVPLNLEELSKLWSVFFQTPHALSVAYQASVVLIEGEGVPQSALPVRAPLAFALPFKQPVIERVVSQEGPAMPIVMGSTLEIQGRNLRGQVTQVRIGQTEVTPALADVSDTRIRLPLSGPGFPVGSLRSGVQSAQVVHPVMMGEPATPHRGVESNAAPFVLRPTIMEITVSDAQGSGDSPRSASVTLRLRPVVGSRQRVVLLLNEAASESPAAYSFVAPPREADSDLVAIPISNVRRALYLARVQVDGAESVLETDTDPNSPTFNQFINPGIWGWLASAAIQVTTPPGRIVARVRVQNENNEDVEGADVSATWTRPDSSTLSRVERTNQSGTARFVLNTGGVSGAYLFTVGNISRADHVFDAGNSILTREITI
jgi:hypothetical protein